MPESRGESFYGGRFYERSFPPDDRGESHYAVAFRSEDGSDSSGAYVTSRHIPDQHRPNHAGFGGTLFISDPERHDIDIAHSTKDARHHIPTLLGMVAQRELKTRGKIPNASDDLSPQSAKMVQKAVDMGLVKNPSRTDSNKVVAANQIDWDGGEGWARSYSSNLSRYGDEVPFERVNAGRQFVRDALRRPKKYQAEQLTID